MKGIKNTIWMLAVLRAASAWGAPGLEFKTEVFQEKILKEKGLEKKSLIPLSKAVPGQEVYFVLSYKNAAESPATDLVINNPIPQHMIYVPAEAAIADQPLVSVDGGKKFALLSESKVSDKLRKVRPALPEDVTHLQWKIKSELAPKDEGKVAFKARLK